MLFTRDGKSLPLSPHGEVVGCELSSAPPLALTYVRNPTLTDYHIEGSEYVLSAKLSPLSAAARTATFVGLRQRTIDCYAQVALQLKSFEAQNVRSGFAIWKDDKRHAAIFVDQGTASVGLEITTSDGTVTNDELLSIRD